MAMPDGLLTSSVSIVRSEDGSRSFLFLGPPLVFYLIPLSRLTRRMTDRQ